jgi:hypothetical protein
VLKKKTLKGPARRASRITSRIDRTTNRVSV